MKRFFSLLILVFLSFTVCHATEEEPHLIYVNQSFDNQEIGDDPNSFIYFWDLYDYEPYRKRMEAARESSEVVKVEKDGNPDNLAAKFNGCVFTEETSYVPMARSTINNLPILSKGVIGFSFMVSDFTADKKAQINTNVTTDRHVSYQENKAYFDFITIRKDNVYWQGETLIREGIETNKWYRVDLAFDVKTRSAKLYFDGEEKNVSLPKDTVNVSEVAFYMPTDENSSWYVDDLRIYEADGVLSDDVVNAEWEAFASSPFYIGPEYEMGRLNHYDHAAYVMLHNKTLTGINLSKLYANNMVIDMPVPVYETGSAIMVPVRPIAEQFGAKVDWDETLKRFKITYNGKVLEASPNESIYYINSTPMKLYPSVELKNGTACMSIDVLFDFLERTYTKKDYILWLGEPPEMKWSMPKGLNPSYYDSLEECINDSILRMLLFDRPSRNEIAEKIKERGEGDDLPRLFVDKFSEIRYGIENDQQFKKVSDNIIANAKKYLDEPIFTTASADGRRIDSLGYVESYFFAWSYAYRFSDESEAEREKYKNRMWEQIEAISEFETFSFESHPLTTSYAALGMSIAYDWLYDVWSPEERAQMEEVAERNIFRHVLNAYNTSVHRHGRQIDLDMGNQGVIINGNFLALATAMYDSNPEICTDVIRGAMRSYEFCIRGFFPDGEWHEGISYWRFTMDYLPYLTKNLKVAFNDDFGITDVPGVLKTGLFPIKMRGALDAFAFGDGQPESAIVGGLMFQAFETGDKELAEYRKRNLGSGSLIDLLYWVYDTENYYVGLGGFDKDVYSKENSTVIFKTGWERADTAVAFHGGANDDGHGHLDSGSFQFDMSGVHFGIQLPREDYNLRDYGFYDKSRWQEFYPDGRKFTGNHYYRQKGEGHNSVVANRKETNAKDPNDPTSFDMKTNGKTEFIKTEFGETQSFALLNMTDLNNIYKSALRGVRLDKINNVIEVQDDIRAIEETDFLWSMHTYADIELSENGKEAILTQGGTKIKAILLSEGDLEFEVLPAEFLEDYGTRVKPKFETPNFVYDKTHEYYLKYGKSCDVKMDAKKLAVRTVADRFKLSVAFMPYVEGNTYMPEYVSLDRWNLTTAERAQLSGVTVDGQPLAGFDSESYNYTINVVTEKSAIPKIEAQAGDKDVEISIIETTTIPGTTSILLKKNDETVGLYSFVINPLNDTTKFHSEKQLPIYGYTVTNEPESANPAKHLFDGEFGTKFATDEQGGAVTVDLGEVVEGNLKLNISCLSGDKRKENFKIEYSEDDVTYKEAFNGSNSGTTTGIEQFDISKRARYIRVSFYGSSEGTWVSVTEMFVSNE